MLPIKAKKMRFIGCHGPLRAQLKAINLDLTGREANQVLVV